MKKRKQGKASAPRKSQQLDRQIGTITPEDFAAGRPYWGRRAHGHRKEPVPTLKPLPEDIVNKLLEASDELPPEEEFTARSAFDYAASTATPTFNFGAGSDFDSGLPNDPPDEYVMRQYALSHWKRRRHVMLFVYGDVDKEDGRFRIHIMFGYSHHERYTTYEQNIRGREQMNKLVRKLDTLFSRGQWNEDVAKQFEQLGPWNLSQ